MAQFLEMFKFLEGRVGVHNPFVVDYLLGRGGVLRSVLRVIKRGDGFATRGGGVLVDELVRRGDWSFIDKLLATDDYVRGRIFASFLRFGHLGDLRKLLRQRRALFFSGDKGRLFLYNMLDYDSRMVTAGSLYSSFAQFYIEVYELFLFNDSGVFDGPWEGFERQCLRGLLEKLDREPYLLFFKLLVSLFAGKGGKIYKIFQEACVEALLSQEVWNDRYNELLFDELNFDLNLNGGVYFYLALEQDQYQFVTFAMGRKIHGHWVGKALELIEQDKSLDFGALGEWKTKLVAYIKSMGY